MKKILAMVAAALLVSSFTPVIAGPFSVTPVRIYMSPSDRAVAVTINNEGDTDLVMQADLYTWKQKPDGEDDLELTEDLLLSPPIIKVPAKSRQVVRLARLQPADMENQQTYRLIVREIPEAAPSTANLQLQIAIAFSMPVFITPPNAKYKLDCTAQKTAMDKVSVSCKNSGNAYAQIIDLTLETSSDQKITARSTGGYMLPSIKRKFDIESENKQPIPNGEAKLTVRLDDGSTQAFDVAISD